LIYLFNILTNSSTHRSLKIYAHNLQNYFSIDQHRFVFHRFSQLSGNVEVGKLAKPMKSPVKADACILRLRAVRCKQDPWDLIRQAKKAPESLEREVSVSEEEKKVSSEASGW
jgi:hypothetical protein